MATQLLPVVPTPNGELSPTVVLMTLGTIDLDRGVVLRDEARAASARLGRRFATRSYAGCFALIAVHDQPVGVDLEMVGHFERAEATSILTPAELRLGLELDDELCATIWSSKEALAKALGDARSYDPRRLDSPLTWRDGAAGRWRAGRLVGLPQGYVGWVCWQATPDPSAEPPQR